MSEDHVHSNLNEETCTQCQGSGVVHKVKTLPKTGQVSCSFCGASNLIHTNEFKVWNFKLMTNNIYKICDQCYNNLETHKKNTKDD